MKTVVLYGVLETESWHVVFLLSSVGISVCSESRIMLFYGSAVKSLPKNLTVSNHCDMNFSRGLWPSAVNRNLVDPASSHMLVSKIKPCMSQYKSIYGETANGSLKQL